MNSQHNRQICGGCCQEKPLTTAYFYRKSDRKSGYDGTCIECRRQQRMSRYRRQNQVTPGIRHANEADRTIEPGDARKKQSDGIVEPSITSTQGEKNSVNYSLLEQRYGKKLTETERIEIRTNLTSFFGALEEFSRQQVDGNG